MAQKDYPVSDPEMVGIINDENHPARRKAQSLYYQMDDKGQKYLDALRTEAKKRKARLVSPQEGSKAETCADNPLGIGCKS